MDRWAIDIDRGDIRRAAVVAAPEPARSPGEIEVAVELAAITANNVTYAALGAPSGVLGPDAGYWDFFGDRASPGRLPVWGFATVTRSDARGLEAGDRLYGYWPLASHAVLLPGKVSAVGFTDTMPRRQALPAFYNNYQRVDALDGYHAADHDLWPIWRPLFVTGWLIADQLADAGEHAADHGAAQVLVTAASSKTALGFAQSMHDRGAAPRVVALTSARSMSFVRQTGLYDDVVAYDAIGTLPLDAAVLIDFANDAGVVAAVRSRLGDALAFDLVVGFTHWDAGGQGAVTGIPRTGFFAPARIAKRAADWGGAGLRSRMGDAWDAFMPVARRLTALDTRTGAAAALAAYQDAVNGRADPSVSVLIRP